MFATKALRQASAAAHAERTPMIKFLGKRTIPCMSILPISSQYLNLTKTQLPSTTHHTHTQYHQPTNCPQISHPPSPPPHRSPPTANKHNNTARSAATPVSPRQMAALDHTPDILWDP
jgi:hypothetical protein